MSYIYSLPEVTAEDLSKLQSLKVTALEHLAAKSDVPLTSTPFGDVPIGSALSYQVFNSIV